MSTTRSGCIRGGVSEFEIESLDRQLKEKFKSKGYRFEVSLLPQKLIESTGRGIKLPELYGLIHAFIACITDSTENDIFEPQQLRDLKSFDSEKSGIKLRSLLWYGKLCRRLNIKPALVTLLVSTEMSKDPKSVINDMCCWAIQYTFNGALEYAGLKDTIITSLASYPVSTQNAEDAVFELHQSIAQLEEEISILHDVAQRNGWEAKLSNLAEQMNKVNEEKVSLNLDNEKSSEMLDEKKKEQNYLQKSIDTLQKHLRNLKDLQTCYTEGAVSESELNEKIKLLDRRSVDRTQIADRMVKSEKALEDYFKISAAANKHNESLEELQKMLDPLHDSLEDLKRVRDDLAVIEKQLRSDRNHHKKRRRDFEERLRKELEPKLAQQEAIVSKLAMEEAELLKEEECLNNTSVHDKENTLHKRAKEYQSAKQKAIKSLRKLENQGCGYERRLNALLKKLESLAVDFDNKDSKSYEQLSALLSHFFNRLLTLKTNNNL